MIVGYDDQSSRYTPATTAGAVNHPNRFEALKAEARGVRDSGEDGESNLVNYNVRNSPGSKYI